MSKPRWLDPLFFAAYGLGALVMAVVDVFAGERFAATTAWGPAAGWLREIAAFDVLVAILCARALRAPPGSELPQSLAAGLSVLSLLIASNNAHAFVAHGVAAHVSNALIHANACVAGIAVAALRRSP